MALRMRATVSVGVESFNQIRWCICIDSELARFRDNFVISPFYPAVILFSFSVCISFPVHAFMPYSLTSKMHHKFALALPYFNAMHALIPVTIIQVLTFYVQFGLRYFLYDVIHNSILGSFLNIHSTVNVHGGNRCNK